ncbi:subtilisin-like protease SBT1.2 [Ananas comosus]|uniref:Subtilisin-like protease SBT1.2 n=1 Tax=Ananas comosus TaxID=4615 RepID=A0A6P5FNC4_ANACO|nr:subtilisin-like protease SBT1.2 [Ananas comosus]
MQVYIVHVQKPDSTSFRRFKDRKEWYASFLPNTTLDSGKPRMVYAYRQAISGFAAWLTSQEVEAMKSTDGVLVAYPDSEYDAQTTYTPEFLGLNAWEDGVWYDSQYGAGQIIGVIDTGFKPGHPSFRDTDVNPPPETWNGSCYWKHSVCNNKLIGAVGYKHGRTVSPEDKNGHGTHTASTAAGNFVDDAHVLGMARGTASGTAPKAHLAIYKVLHITKTASTGTVVKALVSDTLRGIDEAIRNHVNVLSMSLGLEKQRLHADSIAIGSYAAITKGIVPVAAAANAGPFASVIANDAPWILTVGASTTDRRIRAIVKLGNGMELFGETAYQPEGFNSTQLPLVYPGVRKTQKTLNCLNGSMDTFDVKGKIVLCGVGHITNIEKGEIVKAAGGAAMILMNQPWNGNTTFSEPHVIPTAHVSFSDAWKIITYFNSTPNGTAAITFNGTQYGVQPSPSVAYFSSRGPSLMNGNIIKPDVIAPGVNILAAWPFEVGPKPNHTLPPTTHTFNFESGTSMATPHVAGIVAMLKNNHPDWSPAAIKSAIMTTAYTVDVNGKPIGDDSKPMGTPASAYAMGSGHVDPTAANNPGLIYDLHHQDYIHYLCGMGFTDKQVEAIGRGKVQCSKVRAISPEQLNYPSIAVYLSANTTEVTVNRTVTNVGDAVTSYEVKYDEPEGVRVEVTPDMLEFSRAGQMKDFRVKLSIKPGSPTVRMAGQVVEGQMAWSSGKYYVRSPIVVTMQ